MLVRLTKKLADIVNGLDLSHCAEGDVIDLPRHHARMLLLEGWADEVGDGAVPNSAPLWRPDARAVAADRPSSRLVRETEDEDLISRLRSGVRAVANTRDDDPEPNL